MDRSLDMTTQPDPKSSITRTGESQRGEISRGSQRGGYLQRRGEYPLGFSNIDLFRTNPFSLMRRISEEMDRVFQDVGFAREAGFERGGREAIGWSPAIEVKQEDGKFVVNAELPGLSPNDVKIEVANDALVIQGERRYEREENERGVQRSERQYGAFYRAIPLPDGADLEHTNARFQNGLLEVTVPCPQQREQRRSIPIEASGSQYAGQAGTQAGSQTGSQTESRRQQAA
jgi:HSP20 family protein